MHKKHFLLTGILISLTLLLVATLYYPGGSQNDINSVGFNWQHNYLCNLFGEKAVNGADNASRPWAIAGILVLCVSVALFFYEFSKKISEKGSANIIRYCGISAMILSLLAATPYHDSGIAIAGTLELLSMFYITVFVFRSNLHLFKVLSVVCLLVFYTCNFVYYTQNYLYFLPVLQKVLLGLSITWVLSLHYFTTAADFQSVKKANNS
jgi:amino acid transporter